MTGAKPQSQSHEPHESQKTQSPYAQLFRIPGTKAFCVSGAIARLPMSMMGLGIVLALNHMYDNWTIAGVMSAAYVLATAAVTPLYARLFDRFGQRKVGPVILTVQVIVMLGFAFAALMRLPIPLLFVLAVVMGMTQFSFGALVRTRWAYVLDRADKEDLLNTAYALESAIDEIVFIFGPILAAFLAASVHPVSQLFVPTLACAFGGAVFFALRDTQPPVLREITVVAAGTDDADVRLAAGGAAGAAVSADRFDLDRLKTGDRDRNKRNLGGANAQVFSTPGNIGNETTNAHDERLQLHDIDRLHDVLAALERVTGVDSLNRQSPLARRTRAASAIRDLNKGHTLQQIRGFLITDEDRRSALAHLRGELQTSPAMKKLLLIRANEQKAGYRITRPRSLKALPIMPEQVSAKSDFAAWPESVRDHWANRIGNLVLSQANETQVAPLATYAQRRDRMLLSASSRRFPLTAELANIAECTPQTLQYRQDEMVRLIADHWNIRYDADDTDLSTLNEETLNVKATASSPTSKRVSIAQVLEAGLLIAGETLVWERPRKGERWVATVTSEGKLRMDDGREYATPTAAARAVGGSSAGLTVWKRTSNGQKLSDVWKAYRLRKH